MAKLDLPEETKKRMEAGTADLLIAVAAATNVEELRTAAAETVLRMSVATAGPGEDRSLSGLRAAVAYPGLPSTAESSAGPSVLLDPAGTGSELRFLPFAPPASPSVIPWLGLSTTYQAIFAMARELGVGACAVIGPDLAALQADKLRPLLAPVLEGHCDLAMPIYPLGKFEGLLNSAVLAPLTRALYGKRVRFPLAQDIGISARLLPELEEPSQRISSQGNTLFWPATEATLRDRSICQVYLNVHHPATADGIDLSTVLTQTVGPLFAEMEANAALWQRVRGSQPVAISGTAPAFEKDGASVDVRPMLETFQLGFRNLQEMWSLVLPPVTLLELKRLTRLASEQFRMSDGIWVRIVYDFALAYRLRTLSRVHLLGALTPLYLGWVASHVLEVSNMRPYETEQRVEKLARAYEEGKPYLLSRWRWPDRFNP
jgi:glucosylglycerate synthase